MWTCAGALFDADSKQAHAAFRYEMERYNNISAATFKLDKYEKIVDVTNSFQLAKAGEYTADRQVGIFVFWLLSSATVPYVSDKCQMSNHL